MNFNFELKRLGYVLIGTLLYTFGIILFIAPANLLSGGINGIAMLIRLTLELLGYSINLGVLVLLFNIPVIILGIKGISRKFVYYSVVSIIIQVILFATISVATPVFGNDIIANATFGGIFIGVGAGITLRSGASLGGMDIISQFIAIRRQTSVGFISLITNGLLLSISLIFFEPTIALYTMLGFISTNIVVDRIHTGYKRVKLEIITSQGELVIEELLRSYQHGITVSEGYGAYTSQAKQILIMVTQAHEVYDVRKSVLKIDELAFITMSPIRHISGKFNQVIMK